MLCAPKRTLAETAALLNKQVNLALADPKIKKRIANLGCVALPGSPEDYGRTIAADTAKWPRWRNSPARTLIDPCHLLSLVF